MIGVIRAQRVEERRVGIVPATAAAFVESGLPVAVERGAGAAAGYADDAFGAAGATLVADAGAVLAQASALVLVEPPGPELEAALDARHTVLGFLDPLGDPRGMERLAARGVTAFAFELMPRTTRAQSMDALSSQATVAGYHAVLLAAERLPRMLPLLMTAAGTVKARNVLVLGAGVAGLQAIATARRLGAVVTAFDVRAAVREQIESLGARFLAIDVAGDEQAGGYATGLDADQHHREQEAIAQACADADIVITTAQIPGAPAPELITEAAVHGMRSGSVIIDLAAATGGNCACTRVGEEVEVGGVLIIGPANPASAMPGTASDLLAANARAFLQLIASEEGVAPNWDDEIVAGAAVVRDGSVVAERVLERLRSEAGA